MSTKMEAKKPFVLILYGYPGSGKSTFGRLFADEIKNTIHIHSDKVDAELGDSSQKLINYMAKEFLNNGISVVLDIPVNKRSERRQVEQLAKETNAKLVTVWLQIDLESAFDRLSKRDKRKLNDKYSKDYTRSEFEDIVNKSQNPNHEDYVVISGKHTFKTQRTAVFKKLENLKVLTQSQTMPRKIKPELVNLIPQSRGKDDLRRDISVR